jgi:hypothetical protein
MGALPYQRYIRTVGLSILLHALPVLHGQPKEGSGAADEDPWSEGLLNACENPLGIVGMVRGLLEEVAHRLLREAGRKICDRCALSLNARAQIRERSPYFFIHTSILSQTFFGQSVVY